jgi:hypothetical protein
VQSYFSPEALESQYYNGIFFHDSYRMSDTEKKSRVEDNRYKPKLLVQIVPEKGIEKGQCQQESFGMSIERQSLPCRLYRTRKI